jgi:hypothetical protein
MGGKPRLRVGVGYEVGEAESVAVLLALGEAPVECVELGVPVEVVLPLEPTVPLPLPVPEPVGVASELVLPLRNALGVCGALAPALSSNTLALALNVGLPLTVLGSVAAAVPLPLLSMCVPVALPLRASVPLPLEGLAAAVEEGVPAAGTAAAGPAELPPLHVAEPVVVRRGKAEGR